MSTTTSLACYFRKANGDVEWQWALNNDNSYYKLNGSWFTTPYTKIQKYMTSTSLADIQSAATAAQTYYNLTGAMLIGIFAADSSAGHNYPIVASGNELYPEL